VTSRTRHRRHRVSVVAVLLRVTAVAVLAGIFALSHAAPAWTPRLSAPQVTAAMANGGAADPASGLAQEVYRRMPTEIYPEPMRGVARYQPPAPESASSGRGDLLVMTFNLRFASDVRPNLWPQRRPVMRALILDEEPHLIGTQEGRREQLADLERDIGDRYRSIGMGREGGDVGEHMSIFYDWRRLEPLEHGHYWLSTTPDVVGSKSWPGCCPRMVTWVRFRDRADGTQFYAANTHLEAYSAWTRIQEARLILERSAPDSRLPVVLTADFNEPAGAGHAVYDTLVTGGPFADTWVTAAERGPAWGTFNNYRPPTERRPRIDWILASAGVETLSTKVNTFSIGGQYPSDHLPVQALIRLP
jgi:endonuclease/exonuclease/phosphatase family metal-dependent hydrolase